MSILIKDRDMPDTCGSCPCFHAENPMYCQAVKAAVQKPRIVHPYAKGRPEWCPIIEVPKHGRLIDADAKVQTQLYNDEHEEWTDIEMTVDEYLGYCFNEVPTVIPAEEVKDGEV